MDIRALSCGPYAMYVVNARTLFKMLLFCDNNKKKHVYGPKYANPFSAGTDYRRQNPTAIIDVRL